MLSGSGLHAEGLVQYNRHDASIVESGDGMFETRVQEPVEASWCTNEALVVRYGYIGAPIHQEMDIDIRIKLINNDTGNEETVASTTPTHQRTNDDST